MLVVQRVVFPVSVCSFVFLVPMDGSIYGSREQLVEHLSSISRTVLLAVQLVQLVRAQFQDAHHAIVDIL